MNPANQKLFVTPSAFMAVGVLIGVVGLVGWLWYRSAPQAQAGLDGFAHCLAEKGWTMYGAEWCPHCQAEKARFGDAFKNVPYVECPADPAACQAQNVTGYPTWINKDGQRLEGEQGLDGLAKASSCTLPENE